MKRDPFINSVTSTSTSIPGNQLFHRFVRRAAESNYAVPILQHNGYRYGAPALLRRSCSRRAVAQLSHVGSTKFFPPALAAHQSLPD
jgi:hypothetical protein